MKRFSLYLTAACIATAPAFSQDANLGAGISSQPLGGSSQATPSTQPVVMPESSGKSSMLRAEVQKLDTTGADTQLSRGAALDAASQGAGGAPFNVSAQTNFNQGFRPAFTGYGMQPPQMGQFQGSPPLSGQAQFSQLGVGQNQPIRLGVQDSSDPDRKNAELLLAWDKWRNRFAHGVWQKFCATLDGFGTVFVGSIPIKLVNTPSMQFPPGLCATYTCMVTSDHRIEARITSSSGCRALDQIVLEAVMSMQGKHSLQFPKGSMRQSVLSQESLGTGPGGWHGRTYGDVEKVSQSP
jgi:hypothetical protein